MNPPSIDGPLEDTFADHVRNPIFVRVFTWDANQEDWNSVETLSFFDCISKYGVDKDYLWDLVVNDEERDHNDPEYTPNLLFICLYP